MTEVDPVWKAGISKKIAGLTKAVFRLHSSAMEERERQSEVRSSYQQEWAAITGRAKICIEEAKDEAEKHRESIREIVRKEFETKFDSVRQQFEAATLSVKSAAALTISRSESQLVVLKSNYSKLLKTGGGAVSKFKASAKEIQTVHRDVMMKKDAARKKQLDTLSDQAKAKYDQIVAESQAKELELRKKYDSEIAEFERTMNESKMSADEALTRRKMAFEKTVVDLKTEMETLDKFVSEFEKSSTLYKTEIGDIMSKAEKMKSAVMLAKQRELEALEKQLKKAQGDHEDDVAKIKAQITKDESEFAVQIAAKKEDLERERQNYQQVLAEREKVEAEAMREIEEKKKQLADEHRSVMDVMEKEQIEYVEGERGKIRNMFLKMADVQRRFADDVMTMRRNIEEKLAEMVRGANDLKENYRREVEATHERSDEDVRRCRQTMKERSDNSSAEIRLLLTNTAKLRNTMELSRLEDDIASKEDEESKHERLALLKKNRECAMAAIDKSSDVRARTIDLVSRSSMEKAKKQFVLDLKGADDRGKIKMEHALAAQKREKESERLMRQEDQRGQWDLELSELSEQIELKNLERKEVESLNKRSECERVQKMQELKDEIKEMEVAWVEEKQRLVKEWNAKFETMKQQFQEEERQNEMSRRLSEADCQATLERLKKELAAEEERKTTQMAEVNKKLKEEKERGSAQLQNLKNEVDDLTKRTETSVRDLEKKLERLDAERVTRLKNADHDRCEGVREKHKQLREARRKFREDGLARKAEIMDEVQTQEVALHDTKMKLEQARLDAQFDVTCFQAEKDGELEELDAAYKGDIDALNIELENVQKETENLRERHRGRIQSISALKKTRIETQEREFKAQRTRLESENERMKVEKQQVIDTLRENVKQCEERAKSRGSAPEDAEYISELSDIVEERKEALVQLEKDYAGYEAFLSEFEVGFNRLPRGEDGLQPVISANGRRTGRRDGTSSSLRKGPTVIEPATGRKAKGLL